MTTRRAAGIDVDVRTLGVGLLCLVSVALTPVAQLAWLIIFDSTELDASAPDALFVHVLPALTLALVPAAVARYLYTQNASLVTGGVVFVASATVSAFTVRLFALCGPGC